MSAVKKAAKISLLLLSLFVFLFIAVAIYVYVNMGSLAKQMSEDIASRTLGVAVTIGDMDIILDEKKVVVHDITIDNPQGYQRPESIHIDTITLAAESLSKDLLKFARVTVEGTNVNLEVTRNGINLGDIKRHADQQAALAPPASATTQPKVIVRDFTLTKAQINPSEVLVNKDLAYIVAPDIHLSGIGETENGLAPQDAIAQITSAVIREISESAVHAGFMEGLSLETLNEMGVSTFEVFQKNLKDSYNDDVNKLKEGVEGLTNIFQSPNEH